MGYCICERATGLIKGYARYDHLAHDAVTHIELEVDEKPDRETQRWDSVLGFRDATALELSDAADIKLENEATTRWKNDPHNDTLMNILYKADERLRKAESRPAIDKLTFWNQIKTLHKNDSFFDF